MKTLTKLYKRGSSGKLQFWEIGVEQKTGGFLIVANRGQVDGKTVVENGRFISEGKNVGKANETSPEEQAWAEAESKWNKKKDKGYTETEDVATTQVVVLPMLADKWAKHKKNISFPAYIQTKLDGARCTTDGITMMSRGGKEFFFLEHIKEEFKHIEFEEGFYLDGELYSSELTFQEIMSVIKKSKSSNVDYDLLKKIQYHVYDCFDLNNLDQPYSERYEILQNIFKTEFKYIKPVETHVINSEEDVAEFHYIFVAAGWEGAIVRDKSLVYELDHRSNKLLKVKSFMDDEYEIIGVGEASGGDVGTGKFVCIDKKEYVGEAREVKIVNFEDARDGISKTKEFVRRDGKLYYVFDSRPKGTREVRREYFENKDKYIGKMLTVEFFELTDKKIPRFPTGKALRESWDK